MRIYPRALFAIFAAFVACAPFSREERTDTVKQASSQKPDGEPSTPDGNGTAATATPIVGTNAVIRGNLLPNGDVDFYKFTASAGDRVYAATMTSWSAGSSTDSQLTVLASDGTTVIEFDEDNGSFASLSSSIAGATLASAGTYYLKVNDRTAGTTSERPYELHFRLQSGTPTAEVEPNDTSATATALPSNGWISGTRNPATATEQDWYSLALNAGDTVFLSLDLDPERDGTTWNGRLGFGLFGDAANQQLFADDTGTADAIPSEALFVTVKNAGTYYAVVDSASAATGGPTATYHLSVSVHAAAPKAGGNCTKYTSTDVPKTIGPGTGLVSSTITIPDSRRIGDINVGIQLNHALMVEIDAHLRSPAGNDNGIFTDIGAATTGAQTEMDVVFDDEAATPPSFTFLKGLMLKPELNYRLAYFEGEQAQGTWTLDLRDDTAGANGGTLTSWYMEVCDPVPVQACPGNVAATAIFSTDFESGAAGFTHSGTQDEWALGTPAQAATTTANPVAAFTTCNSGTSCWKTDLTGTYNVSSSQDLLSPTINLTTAVAPVNLSWAMKYQMESANFDHLSVDIQEVGGANPKRLFEWLGATMTDTVGSPSVNIGASAGWSTYTANVDAYIGKSVELKVHVDGDVVINFGGAAIDDVTVTHCPSNCGNGVVEVGEACDDGNHADGDCCSSTCTITNNGVCSDGNACTRTDTCTAGACVGSNPVTCSASDPCHAAGTCNTGTGACSNPNAADNTDCSDGNACTSNDKCQSGVCVAGANSCGLTVAPTFPAGSVVTVSWNDPALTSPTDWIAIATRGSVPDTSRQGQFLPAGAHTTGSLPFTGLAPGDYEARLYYDWPTGGNVIQRTASFTVLPVATAQFTSPDATIAVNTPIVVSYTGFPTNATDWIALAPQGAPYSGFAQWAYTNGNASGQVTFNPVAAGNWELRAYYNYAANHGTAAETVVHASRQFVVDPGTPSITTPTSPVPVNTGITVTFSGFSSKPTNWIAVAPAGGAFQSFGGRWQYTNGANSGTLTFAGLPAGNYQARAYFDWAGTQSQTVQASLDFTVAAAGATFTGPVVPVASGSPTIINYSGFPGNQTDWIAIAPPGGNFASFGTRWQYLDGSASGAANFGVLPAGTYEARGYLDWNGTHSQTTATTLTFTVLP